MRVAGLVVACMLAPPTHAQDTRFDKDAPSDIERFDPGERQPEKKKPDPLPGVPVLGPKQDFLPFLRSDFGKGYTYSLDPGSLAIDGVEVRYTVRIDSGGGATTIYHEGLQCPRDLYRIYAYGNAQGTELVAARKPRWRAARATSGRIGGAYRKFLANEILCDPLRPRPKREMLMRLRRQ